MQQKSITKIYSAANHGLEAKIIEIQVDILNGLPATNIVGLPDSAVDESKERVKAAIKNAGFKYPDTRVVINLAPADMAKSGSGFDLPIALGILAQAGNIPAPKPHQLFIGELGLDGEIRKTGGILSRIIEAKKQGFTEIFLPEINLAEAALIAGVTFYTPENLEQLIAHFAGAELSPTKIKKSKSKKLISETDFADIAGQHSAKRALEIAAAGGHNVLLYGPPGSGKTLLAKALSSILPPLTDDEKIELTNIYSISGQIEEGVVEHRPVRSPHHTTSSVALIGGGSNPKPGEVTLAHKGILFMDEFPEFPRNVLEALRQPLEDGIVTVARAKNTFIFPAKFILVVAQNPCPCGGAGTCSCTPGQVAKYNKKISGPLLDRIDLYIEVPRLKYSEYGTTKNNTTSAEVRKNVQAARKKQYARLGSSKLNAHMSAKMLKEHTKLDEASEAILENSANTFNLSGRSIHRILKVARTIADLENSDAITQKHLTEAISYRPKK